MKQRSCSKTTCAGVATATLTYDYDGCVLAIGPLSPTPNPHSYDLCQAHADALTAPAGWQVLRHSPFAGIDERDLNA